MNPFSKLLNWLRCRCGNEIVCAELYTDAHGGWTDELNKNIKLEAEISELRDRQRKAYDYALSRCTEEYDDRASASVVASLLDGEIS
jgi:hypothetical protein